MKLSSSISTNKLHQVNSTESLNAALEKSKSGDTLVLEGSVDYGNIRLVNKTGIRIKAENKRAEVTANLSIDGNSRHIIVENINLTPAVASQRQIISIGKQCRDIIIRHCILSTLPVNMNNLRNRFVGTPSQWVNGIRVLGSNCHVINNVLVNVKLGVLASGPGCRVQKNVIQYFSGHGIRANHHGVQVVSNHIYDAVLSDAGETRSHDAIQLIPPENRFEGGELRNVEIEANVIRSQSRQSSVPRNLQGSLNGIMATDGYFLDTEVTDNILVLNSDQGITFNGAYRLLLASNKILQAASNGARVPGIRLYAQKIHKKTEQWRTDLPFSVTVETNQAAVINLPTSIYKVKNGANNRFGRLEKKITPLSDAKLVGGAATPRLSASNTPPPLTRSANAKALRQISVASISESVQGNVHEVGNGPELQQAILIANAGDTIVITREGDYGKIRITNKQQLRLKSITRHIPIQIALIIDNQSSHVVIENMQLWNHRKADRQVIISSKDTRNITIRGCIVSSVPVQLAHMRDRYSGHPPSWINGIRLLGSNSEIINNHLLNLRLAIVNTGPNTLIQHNRVQYFSEDGIRITHHGARVYNNNIYDAIALNPNNNAHRDAIQLIPPHKHFEGGELSNVQLAGNIIQAWTQPGGAPPNERAILQGIFASDGYFTHCSFVSNTVMVNSDHGITINGVRNLELHNNHVMDLEPANPFTPGIKFYLTRISKNGQQRWLANRHYSLNMSGNQARTVNIPSAAYTAHDQGNNHFQQHTSDLARGPNPIIVRGTDSGVTPAIADAADNAPDANMIKVTNRLELTEAIQRADPGDTVIITEAGNYGLIRINNKEDLRLRAKSADLQINAHLLIDGHSRNIIIENLNIWYSEKNWKPVIHTAPETRNITIRNCIVSSVAVEKNSFRHRLAGQQSDWITGIWLRGSANEVVNNQIVNVKAGIMINGDNTLIQNNLIQYFSDTGIRVINHLVDIKHNNIYDAISVTADSQQRKTGIQLIPPHERFNSGQLRHIRLISNVIQSRNAGSTVADEFHGRLQGITCYDGYLKDSEIHSNTVVVNTEHAIVLNGVSDLQLLNNRVFDSAEEEHFTPGIRLYLTRTININDNDRAQAWRTDLAYSVTYAGNHSPAFNLPEEYYQGTDKGNNRFTTVTTYPARGVDPRLEP